MHAPTVVPQRQGGKLRRGILLLTQTAWKLVVELVTNPKRTKFLGDQARLNALSATVKHSSCLVDELLLRVKRAVPVPGPGWTGSVLFHLEEKRAIAPVEPRNKLNVLIYELNKQDCNARGGTVQPNGVNNVHGFSRNICVGDFSKLTQREPVFVLQQIRWPTIRRDQVMVVKETASYNEKRRSMPR